MTACQTCSEPLPPKTRPGGKPRLYCSTRCKRIARHVKKFGWRPAERLPTLERFMLKVQKGVSPDDCWLWLGHIARHGYGTFGMEGSEFLAHRAAYLLLVGEIPGGLDLDHLCCTHTCVNPEHLEPVTRGENSRRGGPSIGARSEACANGHKWTPENTLRYGPEQRRYCRTCQLARGRETYWRKRGVSA